MNPAVMTYSFSRALEAGVLRLPDVVRRVRALGITRLEVADAQVGEGERPALRSALAETGTEVICYDLSCDVNAPDPAERQARLSRFHGQLEQAAELGARHVMAIPGGHSEETPA